MNSLVEEIRNKQDDFFEGRESSIVNKYTIADIYKAKESNGTITGKVVGITEDFRLIVDLGNYIQGTVAQEDLEHNTERDKGILSNCMFGRNLKFNVKNIRKDGRGYKIELTRKDLQERYLQDFLSSHKVGDDILVKVDYIQDYGLFVDIGYGVIAFIHVNDIGVSRIYDIKRNLAKLDKIVARIKSIEGQRIHLSTKLVSEATNVAISKYTTGQEVIGQVCGVKGNIIFIALDINLRAIAFTNANNYVPNTNDVVKAYVKELDSCNERMILNNLEKVDQAFNWEEKFKNHL